MSNYIELLSKVIRNEIYHEPDSIKITSNEVNKCRTVINDLKKRCPLVLKTYPSLSDPIHFAKIISYARKDRPVHTYVNKLGIKNVIDCCLSVLDKEVKGDFVEVGTLKGGIGILMAGVIVEYDRSRQLYIFDCFEGLDKPCNHDSLFDNEVWHHYSNVFDEYMFDCKYDLDSVVNNFKKYGLDDIPLLVKGWIPNCFDEYENNISVLRIDVDWYEATRDTLLNLYQLVTKGGYVIIDDYNLEGCKKAVDDFRALINCDNPLYEVCADTGIVCWEK